MGTAPGNKYPMNNFGHPVITSMQNPGVKAVAGLHRKRERLLSGLIIIEGAREIRRALLGGISPQDAWYCPSIVSNDPKEELLLRLQEAGASIHAVNARVYEKISYRAGSEGIILVAGRPVSGIGDPGPGENPIYIVMDGVEKPGNQGAVFRTADGAGVSGIILTGGGTEIHNPNVIRASLGTVFAVPSMETTIDKAIVWFRERNISIITSTPAAGTTFFDADFSGPCALVVGSEDKGAAARWIDEADLNVSIPMNGVADSLNVSVSASILIYEAVRQRNIRRK